MTDELMALADRVEAESGNGEHWQLEDEVKRAAWALGVKPGPFLTSLDAAMTLVSGGWVWTIEGGDSNSRGIAWVRNMKGDTVSEVNSLAATPALALTAAALRARAAC